MGYETVYNITLLNATPDEERRIADRLSELDVIGYAFDEYLESLGAVKWYDEQDDMRIVSAEFPHVHIVISGDGENNDDFWEDHFLGGKVQRCYGEVVYEPFDPAKLE